MPESQFVPLQPPLLSKSISVVPVSAVSAAEKGTAVTANNVSVIAAAQMMFTHLLNKLTVIHSY